MKNVSLWPLRSGSTTSLFLSRDSPLCDPCALSSRPVACPAVPPGPREQAEREQAEGTKGRPECGNCLVVGAEADPECAGITACFLAPSGKAGDSERGFQCEEEPDDW